MPVHRCYMRLTSSGEQAVHITFPKPCQPRVWYALRYADPSTGGNTVWTVFLKEPVIQLLINITPVNYLTWLEFLV
jgi:hypothetical protein